MKTKVIIIGIDGADPLIMSQIFNRKKVMHLVSTIPPSTAASWTSIFSGVNPGKHSIYDFISFKEYRILSSLDVRYPRIWNILSESGLQSILINVPLTYPPEPIKGIIIPGIPLKEDYVKLVKAHIRKVMHEVGYIPDVGEYDVMRMILTKKTRELERTIKKSIHARTELTIRLAEKHPWKLLITIYTEIDRLQHLFMHDLEYIKTWYKLIIRDIEKIINELSDNDCLVLIVSDHGFQECKYIFYFNELLVRMGLQPIDCNPVIRASKIFLNLSLNKLKNILPHVLIDSGIRFALKTKKYKNFHLEYQMNVPSIKAVSFYGNFSTIKISKLSISCARKILSKIKSMYSSLIENILSPVDLYWGPYVNLAPDFVIKFKEKVSGFTVVNVPKIIEHSSRAIEPRTGIHRLTGSLIVIKEHVQEKVSDIKVRAWDITPTILYYLGLPLLDSFDGKVIKNIFSDNLLLKRKPEIISSYKIITKYKIMKLKSYQLKRSRNRRK